MPVPEGEKAQIRNENLGRKYFALEKSYAAQGCVKLKAIS